MTRSVNISHFLQTFLCQNPQVFVKDYLTKFSKHVLRIGSGHRSLHIINHKVLTSTRVKGVEKRFIKEITYNSELIC